MNFTLNIDMNNAAFEDGRELSTILAVLISRIPTHPAPNDTGSIRDTNGNVVGRWSVTA